MVLCRINPSCRPQRIKVASGDINVNVVGIQFVLWNICRHIETYRLTYSKYSCYSLRLLHNFMVFFNSLKKVFVKCASSSLQHFLRFIRTCNFPSMLGTSDEALHSSKGSGPDSDTHPRGVLNGFFTLNRLLSSTFCSTFSLSTDTFPDALRVWVCDS